MVQDLNFRTHGSRQALPMLQDPRASAMSAGSPHSAVPPQIDAHPACDIKASRGRKFRYFLARLGGSKAFLCNYAGSTWATNAREGL
jgi:hypothetical protein